MEDETINIRVKKDSIWKYSTFILAAALIVMVFLYVKTDKTNTVPTGPTGKVVANPEQNLPPQQQKVSVSIDDDAVLGNIDAPVTIVEFSDYECPFCGRFYQQTMPSIKKEYVDTGKVKVVFRDFPLSFHKNAQVAAEAVECVGENGDDAYWKMHDKVFENQINLSEENLKKWAKEIGYDIDDCLKSGKMKSEIQKDFNDGRSYGVQGTPAFFVNGKLISGAQPYNVFKQAIEDALAK